MDKVIIDKVDVSGCNNIGEWEHCNICQVLIKTVPNRHQCLTEGDLRCEFYPDCYYKQLQRAKAEIEELKKQVRNNETAYHTELGTYNMECGNLLEENKTLIAENERIKRDFLKHNQWLQDQKKEIDELKAENKKLKYYLNKIREDELNSMDVEWDEYITECTSTEYTNVITFVELALGERDE